MNREANEVIHLFTISESLLKYYVFFLSTLMLPIASYWLYLKVMQMPACPFRLPVGG